MQGGQGVPGSGHSPGPRWVVQPHPRACWGRRNAHVSGLSSGCSMESLRLPGFCGTASPSELCWGPFSLQKCNPSLGRGGWMWLCPPCLLKLSQVVTVARDGPALDQDLTGAGGGREMQSCGRILFIKPTSNKESTLPCREEG